MSRRQPDRVAHCAPGGTSCLEVRDSCRTPPLGFLSRQMHQEIPEPVLPLTMTRLTGGGRALARRAVGAPRHIHLERPARTVI